MSDLKPCPFCGGRAEKEGHDDLPLGRVKCRNCQIHTMWYANIDDAASVWNTRADSAALAAAVQAEREAIKEMIVRQHKVNVPDEQFRSGVHFACENLHAMIRSRGPAPAVDARGIVREYVEAHAGLDNEFEIRSEESIAAETRFESAYNALCALVSPATGEGRRCTCDYDHVSDDEHRPWCGGPPPKESVIDVVRRFLVAFDAHVASYPRGGVENAYDAIQFDRELTALRALVSPTTGQQQEPK